MCFKNCFKNLLTIFNAKSFRKFCQVTTFICEVSFVILHYFHYFFIFLNIFFRLIICYFYKFCTSVLIYMYIVTLNFYPHIPWIICPEFILMRVKEHKLETNWWFFFLKRREINRPFEWLGIRKALYIITSASKEAMYRKFENVRPYIMPFIPVKYALYIHSCI